MSYRNIQLQVDDDDSVDMIDLTRSSSPEPEEPPRRLWQRSSPNAPADIKIKKSPRGKVARPGASGQPSKRIRPSHLHSIIETSDPADIKRVLLHLCTISPALSGAVARALAPKSTFAQATIAQYFPKRAPAPGVKQEPVKDTPVKAESSSKHPQGLKALLSVKRERQPSPTLSDGYSSAEFLEVPHTPSRSNCMLKFETDKTEAHSAKRGLRCINCKRFEVEEGPQCVFHPGRKTVIKREPRWTCCKRTLGELGCEVAATHVTESNARKRERTPSDPFKYFERQPSKSPRLD
ncbi:hypothetical protein BDV95DRAFT_559616 [Massariosphaeria phaeospora]|uniref:Uncharacterized protein n=1 Tax=Massariosphaeria phaeospora TaxID=100035 RepID=A0A7C8IEF8_9PLEO|nr:hypothetical protein BDV95DRAFT_559616 [Massariosphaeria phaeospora]